MKQKIIQSLTSLIIFKVIPWTIIFIIIIFEVVAFVLMTIGINHTLNLNSLFLSSFVTIMMLAISKGLNAFNSWWKLLCSIEPYSSEIPDDKLEDYIHRGIEIMADNLKCYKIIEQLREDNKELREELENHRGNIIH